MKKITTLGPSIQFFSNFTHRNHSLISDITWFTFQGNFVCLALYVITYVCALKLSMDCLKVGSGATSIIRRILNPIRDGWASNILKHSPEMDFVWLDIKQIIYSCNAP